MTQTQELHPQGAMSVDRFARWAGIGRTLAWEQIRLGELQAIKIGHRTLVAIEEASRWLATRPLREVANV